MENTIIWGIYRGLYWDSVKENGNYFNIIVHIYIYTNHRTSNNANDINLGHHLKHKQLTIFNRRKALIT